MRHLFRSRHADEALLDADAQLLERGFSLLVDLFCLGQFLLPSLVEILQKLLTLVELLRNLGLGNLLDSTVGLRDADDLLLQGRSFRVDLLHWDRDATHATASAELAT